MSSGVMRPGTRSAPSWMLGRVGGGDLEAFVGGLLGMVGVEKLAGLGEGVADHQRLGGVEAHGRVHKGLLDAVRFVHDEQEFGRVKALDAVGLVGGEGDGEAVGGDGVAVDWVSLPERGTSALAMAVASSGQRMCSIWRCVGEMTTTLAAWGVFRATRG